MTTQIDDMINNGTDISDTDGRSNTTDNNRDISCLPHTWKLIIRILSNSVYEYLQMYNLLPVQHKGCTRNCRGAKDQLLIDKMMLNDCKKGHTGFLDFGKS